MYRRFTACRCVLIIFNRIAITATVSTFIYKKVFGRNRKINTAIKIFRQRNLCCPIRFVTIVIKFDICGAQKDRFFITKRFFMIAVQQLHHSSIQQYFCIFDAWQSVSNYQNRFVLEKSFKILRNNTLVFGIKRIGCFIQISVTSDFFYSKFNRFKTSAQGP